MNLIAVGSWSTWAVWVAFLAAAVVIAVAGSKLTRLADRLADVTGLGEAMFGAVLLGGTTSLPGIVTSVSTAWQGYGELAVSNAIGGIAAQTTFLAIADASYRKANLEHAAASIENLVQTALLAALLSIVLLGSGTPDVTLLGVHPISVLLVLTYLYGLHLVRVSGNMHLWRPEITSQTREDVPDGDQSYSVAATWVGFVTLGLVTAAAGYVVAEAGIEIAARTGLSQTVVGTFLTAIATSLPELVTTLAAVRQGALTLAVGGIIGGNSFDVLFVAFSDVAYRGGSIYDSIADRQVFVIGLTLLLTTTLLLGLLRRERVGVARIGFESMAVLVIYAVGALLQLWLG